MGAPVAVPVIEVRTLGAGGGSIARIDKGGMLSVGPESAGARPGPGCYGAGGDAATVTDANLVLGRLNPDFFLGGELKLHPERAAAVIDPLARSLGLDREEAARAIVDLADENMTNAIRLLTIERGSIPATSCWSPSGAPGRCTQPPSPPSWACAGGRAAASGLCSAFGAALARLRVERMQTLGMRHTAVDDGELAARFRAMLRPGRREIEAEGLRGAARERARPEQCATRSRTTSRTWSTGSRTDCPRRSSASTADTRNSSATSSPITPWSWCISRRRWPRPRRNRRPPPTAPAAPAPCGPSPSARAGYRRDRLPVGTELRGPAVVEELDSTTFIPEGVHLAVDGLGNLVLTLPSAAPEEE